MSRRAGDRSVALLAALSTHAAFAAAVASMAYALAHGLQTGRGPLAGAPAVAADCVLMLQFPLLHSWLLTRRGRRWLPRRPLAPLDRRLDLTAYAAIASLQLLLTFWAWSPTGIVWHRPMGTSGTVQWLLFAAAWLFLLRALDDAGLAVQTGAAGWLALWRGRPVDYGELPTNGLFRACRQPIYLGFCLVLWTAPCWTPDMLLLAVGWGLYCLLGPLHKESRFSARYGERFATYRAAVPYMLPRWRR